MRFQQPMQKPFSTILFIYRDEWIRLIVYISFNLGYIFIKGYESNRGEKTSNIFNASFTHQISISHENFDDFCQALKLKTNSRDNMCDTLREKFNGKFGLQLLSDYLKGHGVKFGEYIHDKSDD